MQYLMMVLVRVLHVQAQGRLCFQSAAAQQAASLLLQQQLLLLLKQLPLQLPSLRLLLPRPRPPSPASSP